ncbi:hypothetical protein DAMNIGENAA_20130 [Desulforhabdus amnigena]|jgi:hypothetical protein|uniref:DUF434 domain-containing protein n=1 Tax=Desulforhabdus amnigena TaxID=40218 RepID=A0A9W6FTR2_9BACT|nr:hypothetical protein DAMNIGENAA_20130 [Desulforhabdus amnigena]
MMQVNLMGFSAPQTDSTKSMLSKERRWLISQAGADFFFFQNRRYPREAALEWVGNRYQLTHMERMLLHRGIFSQEKGLRRRAKCCKGAGWQSQLLAVDGHNVQITLESAILGRPLLMSNDGALRDLAGQSARFRFSEVSEMAVDTLFRFLEEFRPHRVLFLFDAPMSHSGRLADIYRRRLKSLRIPGEARAVPVPEREFPYEGAVVATSDSAVINEVSHWLDLARGAIEWSGILELAADFSSLILANPTEQYSLTDQSLF